MDLSQHEWPTLPVSGATSPPTSPTLCTENVWSRRLASAAAATEATHDTEATEATESTEATEATEATAMNIASLATMCDAATAELRVDLLLLPRK